LKQKLLQKNDIAFFEERARRLVNVDMDGHHYRDHDAAAAADIGILGTGGTETYGAKSAPDEMDLRQLQAETIVIGPDTLVKNSTLTLGGLPS
jgi:hypothetical protein